MPFEVWVKNHFKESPVISAIYVVVMTCIAAVPVTEGVHSWQKHKSEQRVQSAPDQCPAGSRMVMNNITTDASDLPPGVHSTGVYIRGNPCVTINGATNKNTTTGVDLEPEAKEPQK